MTDLEILARILMALGFGAILGLETETRTSAEGKTSKAANLLRAQRIGGVRTYTVLSLFGAVGGILFNVGHKEFAYLMFVAVFGIVLAAYVLNASSHKLFGMTTEIAILITVLVGFAATANLMSLQLLLVVIVLLAFILSQKRGILRLTEKLEHSEYEDLVKFTIVAIVIFPFLPNQDILVRDIPLLSQLMSSLGMNIDRFDAVTLLNPFKLWQYVVLISGINLLGYFAYRVFGRHRGLLLTGLFGGLVSSTSTMLALAMRSRVEKSRSAGEGLAASALIANAVSFTQIMVLSFSASAVFAGKIAPVALAMAVGSGVVALFFMGSKSKDFDLKHTPYALGPALKFAFLLTAIRIMVQLVNVYFGQNGFVLAMSLSGMIGLDIASITVADVFAQGAVSLQVGLLTFLLANLVNFTMKAMYARWQGSSAHSRIVFWGMTASSLCGIAVTALILFRGV